MSTNDTFDKWYEKLSKEEQKNLINHILETKLTLVTEGYFTGPAGKILNKGLYSGPAGQLASTICTYCGKRI